MNFDKSKLNFHCHSCGCKLSNNLLNAVIDWYDKSAPYAIVDEVEKGVVDYVSDFEYFKKKLHKPMNLENSLVSNDKYVGSLHNHGKAVHAMDMINDCKLFNGDYDCKLINGCDGKDSDEPAVATLLDCNMTIEQAKIMIVDPRFDDILSTKGCGFLEGMAIYKSRYLSFDQEPCQNVLNDDDVVEILNDCACEWSGCLCDNRSKYFGDHKVVESDVLVINDVDRKEPSKFDDFLIFISGYPLIIFGVIGILCTAFVGHELGYDHVTVSLVCSLIFSFVAGCVLACGGD